MKKTDLITLISEHSELSKTDAKTSVETILKTLTQGITSGERVEIRGFGALDKKYAKPRVGINPKTSERTQVEGKFIPFFKPGKLLKELINRDQPNV